MPIRSVFFDLDGTLLDTEPGILGCFRHTLNSLGAPVWPDEHLRKFIGPPLQQVFRGLLGDSARADRAVEIYRRCYDAKGKLEATPYPGIPEALAELCQKYQLVVATSKRMVFAEQMIEHFGFSRFFSGIYGVLPDNLGESKSSLIRRILADFGLSPGETVMIGDREYDMIGAGANGLVSVGALWGYGSREELEGHGAHFLCPTPAQLPALVYSIS